MREGVNMAEQKKGGEAQSLQTPSISYDNSNSKGNGKLSNNQIVRNKFSYFNTQSDDYLDNLTPEKNVTLLDVFEYVRTDNGRDNTSHDMVKIQGTFRKAHDSTIISTSGLMQFEIKCSSEFVDKLKSDLINVKDIDVLMVFKNRANDGLNVIVPSSEAVEIGNYDVGKYRDSNNNIFNMYDEYFFRNIGRRIKKTDRCYLSHDPNIYISDKVQAGAWKYKQLSEYWKETKDIAHSIVRVDAEPLFYSIDYKGKPMLEPLPFIEFMINKGFIRERESDNFIKIENKILKYFPKEEIPNFLKKFVPDDSLQNEVLKCISHKWKIQIMDFMQLMDGQEIKYHRDTADAVYIPFKNGVAKTTKDDVKMLDYSDDEIGFFPEGIESMNHNFTPTLQKGSSQYEGKPKRCIRYAMVGNDKPISELTGKEKSDFKAACSMVGYLIDSHKKSSEAYCIILSDEGSNDVANAGGRGKTLLLELISKVRTRLYKGKNDWRKDDKFALAGLQKHNTLIVHDDVPAGYDWIANYTLITGDMVVRDLYKSPFVLKFKESPKIVVTTNNAVRYNENADSTNRRYREYKFSKFWNINRTPSEYFGGGDFFDDWSEQDWQEAFDFLVECVQIYLNEGVIPIKYDKTFDNYVATFNDVREQEFERIFNELSSETEFNVTRFREIHMQKHHGNGADFNLSTVKARDSINHYIDYHKLDWEYIRSEKVWRRACMSGLDSVPDNSLPF